MKRLGALALLVLLVADAEARVGGGGGFSTGSNSSSSSGGGSGGGGGDGGELLVALLRLCIMYPEIGVPVAVLVVGFVIWEQRNRQIAVPASYSPVRQRVAGRGQGLKTAWQTLASKDPALSRPVLDDLLQVVHRRAWEAASQRDFSALAPYVSPTAAAALQAKVPAGAAVDELVTASVAVRGLELSRAQATLTVQFASSRRVKTGAEVRHRYVEERWTFVRAATATSPSPEAVQRLGCPSCGAAAQCDPMGRCVHCGTPVTGGQHGWLATQVEITVDRAIQPPTTSAWSPEEPSFRAATVVDPDLSSALRAFQGRHPKFVGKDFEARVRHVFVSLQQAWGAGRWQDARPFTTDMAWNTLRFWIDQYAAAGLVNRVTDPKLERMQVVRVTVDGWYESITVRLWATVRDWVEDTRSQKIISGKRDVDHKFSEYWTFVRAIGTGDASGDPSRCPSCGAPLDKINAAGVCGYCDSVVTTGKFDWVLSRIDQAEVYEG
jgi:predicted lipid-binding transport protein (Tim44 family)